MTNDEKFKAIVERIKAKGWLVEHQYISVMMIINYFDKLEKLELVECAFNMTSTGKDVVAVCEEFDWQPTDKDIIEFMNDMVDEPDRLGLTYIISRFRDDRDGFLEEVKKFKEGENGAVS